MQHGAEAFRVVLDLPRFGGRDVLVDVAHHAHRLVQRVLLAVVFDQVAHRGEGAGRFGEQRAVVVGQLRFHHRRHLAEVLGDEVGHAVDEVAPRRGEFLVVVAHELGPREVGVGGLRAGHRDVVAHGVHRVAFEDVLDIDDDAARRAELLAFHRHELGRHDLLGQVERAELAGFAAARALAVVGEHLGGPDLRMERDVVFAHEVIARRLWAVPPLAPRLGVTRTARPLDRGGKVADHRVEPHVQALVRVVDPAGHGDRDAPVDVARDCARLDFAEQADREVQHVRAPALARLEPRQIRVGERRQVEEVVFALLEDRCFAVDLGDRVDQFVGVELVAAVVALVAARARRMADRAFALDVAVGQRAPGGRRDRDFLHALVDVAVGKALAEQLLYHQFVVLGGGAREEVVTQAELAQVAGDDAVVAVGEFLRGHAFLVRFHEDRGAVLIGAGDHEHIIALHALVARIDVGGHAEPGDVADMTGAVGIRPSNIHHNMSHAPIIRPS